MGKVIIMGGLGAALAYFYDLQTADRVKMEAEVLSVDTEFRCAQNHEEMCKYFVVTTIPNQKLQKKFRVPWQYYHMKEIVPHQSFMQVIVKKKKLFGPRILELAPEEMRRIMERKPEWIK